MKSTISSRHLLIFLILKKTYIHNSIKLEGIRDGKIQISTSSKSRESREFQDSKISEKNSFPNLNLSMSQKHMSYEESTLQISILALESILSKENSRFARRKKILSSRKDTKGISENNR